MLGHTGWRAQFSSDDIIARKESEDDLCAFVPLGGVVGSPQSDPMLLVSALLADKGSGPNSPGALP